MARFFLFEKIIKINYEKILSIILLLVISVIYGQEKNTKKVWRVNFLNPGIEYEMPTGNNTTLSVGAGLGYSVSYQHTDVGTGSGAITSFNPFVDIQHKWFYNFDKRKEKGLKTVNNSGNFVSARFLTRSGSLFGNSNGTDGVDFAVGPTWGIQRIYGKNFHFLFDMGPIYYFDTNGKGYYFPLMIQLNLGFDL